MYIKAAEVDPSFLKLIPDYFKMQEICDKAVKEGCSSLEYVPDWFVTREWMWMWCDDYYDNNDTNKLFGVV